MDFNFINLSKSRYFHRDFEAFLGEALKWITTHPWASIASFWLHNEDEKSFRCLKNYNRYLKSFDQGAIINEENLGKYYDQFFQGDILEVSNVDHDLSFEPIVGKLLSPSTRSWMSVSLRIANRSIGFLRVDFDKKCGWTSKERDLMRGVALLIKQSYLENYFVDSDHWTDEPFQEHTAESYKDFRSKVEDYSFFTAHNLRHPVTNILSLIDLVKQVEDVKESRQELYELIKIETLKLDEVVRVMIEKLNLDE